MELEDAPAVAFALSYLTLLASVLAWAVAELISRWRKAHPKPRNWIYGTLQHPEMNPKQRHRQCPKTGEVQIILWRAGEQGHTQDYWYATDSYWWPFFVADHAQDAPAT